MEDYDILYRLRLNNLVRGRRYGPVPQKIYLKKLIKYGDENIIIEYAKVRTTWSQPDRPVTRSVKPKDRRDDSVSRSREMIYKLNKCNLKKHGKYETRFWTFTFKSPYREECKDIKNANVYFRKFIRRLNISLGYKSKYLAVIEFQKDGTVHYHVVFYNLPFIVQHPDVLKIPRIRRLYDQTDFKKAMSDIWTFGGSQGIKLSGVKNVSAYVSKYLRKETLDKRFYGQKVYFTSRGLIRPYESFDEHEVDRVLQNDNMEVVHRRIKYPDRTITTKLIDKNYE